MDTVYNSSRIASSLSSSQFHSTDQVTDILLSCSDNRLPKILLKKEVRRRPGETPRSLGRRRCTLLGVLQVQLSDPPSSKALGQNFFDHMS
jgi:hypothetical protein